MRARAEAEEAQRQQQQGLGRPIISTELQGQRFVAVGKKLYDSPKWKTFHDFLADYIRSALGNDWGTAELAKPPEERHPIVVWYQMLCEHQQTFVTEPGKVSFAIGNGATAAYMNLAYDLYALEHTVELQRRLLERLRNPKTFVGALQEVSVAAKLLRAGFELEFEDEDDGSRTHVEFTATYKRTGRKFSVEVKRGDACRAKINRLLHRALVKNADHARLVFIEVNEPDMESDALPPTVLSHALGRLSQYERDPATSALPPAYVFVTNTPWQHGLDQKGHRCSALAHGFRIPEFQNGHAFASIRAAVDAREAHIEMHDLMRSIQDHSNIPSTFEAETPERAFKSMPPRLVVGERLSVPDASGNLCEGVLEQGLVLEQTSEAHCVVKLDGNRRLICKVPLTDLEMQVWRQHPNTFFGVIDPNVREPAKTALDWYDFFFWHIPRDAKRAPTRIHEALARHRAHVRA